MRNKKKKKEENEHPMMMRMIVVAVVSDVGTKKKAADHMNLSFFSPLLPLHHHPDQQLLPMMKLLHLNHEFVDDCSDDGTNIS